MKNLKIGQKILITVAAIFILFTIGLAGFIGTTSFNNLTALKQAELERTSQILANRVIEMEENAARVAQSFETNEPVAAEIELITSLGPYYADPASYFPEDFVAPGDPIEQADQVFTFQAQLQLIKLLQPVQQLNNLSSVSFYLLSPFAVVSEAEPVLAFRLEEEALLLTQFERKGDVGQRIIYRAPTTEFTPPPPDYFDISTAYSSDPQQLYQENSFTPVTEPVENVIFNQDWTETETPQVQLVVEENVPVIQTWYPVHLPIADPETWEEETAPVGLVLIEQRLDGLLLASLKDQLGLDVGFGQNNQLLITSLGPGPAMSAAAALPPPAQPLILDGDASFYHAHDNLTFEEDPEALQAIVFSPVSEIAQLIQSLRWQIGLIALGGVLLTSLVVYLSINYLVNRPLNNLMRGVRLISAGDLSQNVPVQSRDELGDLAAAFNGMADQLRGLIGSLEERVAARTQRLEIVAALSERLNAILNVDDLLSEVVHQIQENFAYYQTQIYLLDEDENRLKLVEGTGQAAAKMKAQGRAVLLSDTRSLIARAARRGQIIRVDDLAHLEDWEPNPLLPHSRSEMAVPIKIGSDRRVVGVLDVQQDHVAGLDESDASTLRSLANQIAVAMRNARLFEQAQQALAEARAAQERYVEQAWDNAKTTRRNLDRVSYSADGASSLPETELIQARQATRGHHQPMWLTDDNRPAPVDPQQPPGAAKALVAPIKLRDVTIGNLQLHGIDRSQTWTETEMKLISAVIEQVAQTAETLRLLDETQEQASRERLIGQVSNKLRGAPDLESLMKIGVEEISRVLQPGRAFVRLGSEAELTQPAANGDSSPSQTDSTPQPTPGASNGQGDKTHE